MDQQAKKKKKLYEFALLHRRPYWHRADFAAVTVVTLALFIKFGWSLTDKEDLLAMASLIFGVLINGIFLLCNHWSVAYHETIAYQSLNGAQIDKCTHVKVRIDNKKQN